MKAYIDSSVLLRILFGQPHSLQEWNYIEEGISSALIEVECLRTLDRLKLIEQLDEKEIAIRREAIFRLGLTLIELTHPCFPGRPNHFLPSWALWTLFTLRQHYCGATIPELTFLWPHMIQL